MSVAPRIHIEFAAGSSKAAILRRGPSEWTRLVLWDTSTDEIQLGSWFRGRIYEDSCSISPNGELFAYLAVKHPGNHGADDCDSWTAISRPPWLTAIAFWPQTGTQGISTDFVDDSTLLISHPHWDKLSPREQLPDFFDILSKFTGRDPPDQTLPSPARSTAKFIGGAGVDQHGQTFEYVDGRLMRGRLLIADFATMTPQPEPSPDWARSW